MVTLNGTTLTELPERVRWAGYDRRRVTAGIAHFNVGNFHRTHQAVYLDRCLALPGHAGWGVCGIGMIASEAERAKAASFARQDGLYTLSLFPPYGQPTSAVIGSIVDYLFAPADPRAVVVRLSDPAIRIVSMTITKDGYNIDQTTSRFRLDTPDVAHDLADAEMPKTVFGFVVASLARRRAQGLPPFTVLSCDNLRHNGDVARRAILAFAAARDPELAKWIEAHVTFPNSMVDRISPVVTPETVRRLNDLTGIQDEIPVFAEDFAQWVVEDRFCNGRPDLKAAGVQFTDDVEAYAQIKLGMLNSTHIMLSHPGYLGGYQFVHEAMADWRILALLRGFLDEDVIPLLRVPPSMVVGRYREVVLERLSNPALNDPLTRLVSNSGLKIPVLLSEMIRRCLDRGGDCRRFAFLLATFARYLAGIDDKGNSFEPKEPHLTKDDRALVTDPDPTAPLRISTLRGLGLEHSQAFVKIFVDYRKMIERIGTLKALSLMC